MSENNFKNYKDEENMKIVKIVWICLNAGLIIYALILVIYAKIFRKNEIISLVKKNNFRRL